MRLFAVVSLGLLLWGRVALGQISPDEVAVLYNSKVPESERLANKYRQARGIPRDNLIGLDLPNTADISREVYNEEIVAPLRRQFDVRNWWERRSMAAGREPVRNKIRVLVTMYGVPLRIEPKPKAQGAPPPKNPMEGRDEASVDSELALFGVEGVPIDSAMPNKFHKSPVSIADAKLPFLMLTARIDASTPEICDRMIEDAVETEKTGLWGKAYVDIANKFPQGDQWLESVVKLDRDKGIPTVVDRFNDTLPKNYPMTDASLYYGWYDGHVSGPFLNSKFRFRRGAVAMHLHSFSAEQLRNTSKNWSAALLEKGAAVTIGNVYEPFLHLTHDFGILHERLLAGYTWVEACWMAMPAASWQGVVLGDPLYRPFLHFDGTGEKLGGDIEYRALRAAAIEWRDNPRERLSQIGEASERMKSGVLAEALGLEMAELKDTAGAQRWYREAKANYPKMEDKLRQDIHLIALDRAANKKDVAILGLKDTQLRYNTLPEAEALKGWLAILDPPPPPPPPQPQKPQPSN